MQLTATLAMTVSSTASQMLSAASKARGTRRFLNSLDAQIVRPWLRFQIRLIRFSQGAGFLWLRRGDSSEGPPIRGFLRERGGAA